MIIWTNSNVKRGYWLPSATIKHLQSLRRAQVSNYILPPNHRNHRRQKNRSKICYFLIYFFLVICEGNSHSSRAKLLTETHNPITITNLPNSLAIQVQGWYSLYLKESVSATGKWRIICLNTKAWSLLIVVSSSYCLYLCSICQRLGMWSTIYTTFAVVQGRLLFVW